MLYLYLCVYGFQGKLMKLHDLIFYLIVQLIILKYKQVLKIIYIHNVNIEKLFRFISLKLLARNFLSAFRICLLAQSCN